MYVVSCYVNAWNYGTHFVIRLALKGYDIVHAVDVELFPLSHEITLNPAGSVE